MGAVRPKLLPISRFNSLSVLRITTATLSNAARYVRTVAISSASPPASLYSRLSLPKRLEKPAATISAPAVTRDG